MPEWRDIAVELANRHVHYQFRAIRSVEEKSENVAAGRGIAILPESTATFYRRDDVIVTAITDIGPNQVCLAWDAARHTSLISEFVSLALAADH